MNEPADKDHEEFTSHHLEVRQWIRQETLQTEKNEDKYNERPISP